MKRLTVRADEVKVGDRLADPDTGEPWEAVTDTETLPLRSVVGSGLPVEGVEIWTDADPMGMPALTLAPSDQVEVWR